MRIVCDREQLGCEFYFYQAEKIVLLNAVELSGHFTDTYLTDLEFGACTYQGLYVEVPTEHSNETLIQHMEHLMRHSESFVHIEIESIEYEGIIILFKKRKNRNTALKTFQRRFGEICSELQPIEFSIGLPENTLH